jgi:hypothetical protein
MAPSRLPLLCDVAASTECSAVQCSAVAGRLNSINSLYSIHIELLSDPEGNHTAHWSVHTAASSKEKVQLDFSQFVTLTLP